MSCHVGYPLMCVQGVSCTHFLTHSHTHTHKDTACHIHAVSICQVCEASNAINLFLSFPGGVIAHCTKWVCALIFKELLKSEKTQFKPRKITDRGILVSYIEYLCSPAILFNIFACLKLIFCLQTKTCCHVYLGRQRANE